MPNWVPPLKGLADFTGRVIHAHSFRDAQDFKGQRLLLIGNGYSGEDIAMQCVKFGAARATIGFRTAAAGHDFQDWPIVERKLPTHYDRASGEFKFEDGGGLEVDCVILCANQILRRVRPESPRRPPRNRRDTCSMAWRRHLCTDALVDSHTGRRDRPALRGRLPLVGVGPLAQGQVRQREGRLQPPAAAADLRRAAAAAAAGFLLTARRRRTTTGRRQARHMYRANAGGE